MTFGLIRGLPTMTLFFLASIAIGLVLQPHGASLRLATDTLLLEFLAGAWIAYFFVSGVHLSPFLSNVLMFIAGVVFLCGLGFGSITVCRRV